ncbi:MAG: SoxR reducing system RseC family protein [Bacteroides sp.]|nr:SoxR reducing system RseC family protein [Bacteroides sp.]
MANKTIQHQGIVENIDGTQIQVRIVQTSACSGCSAKAHCSSADSKEKIIEIEDHSGMYRTGDEVMITGEMSVGIKAVWLAFVWPFLVLVVSLFIFMSVWNDELLASLGSLLLLTGYYLLLWMNKTRLKRKLSFTIKPIKNN